MIQILLAFIAAIAATGREPASVPEPASGEPLVVIELFTSQGCPMCPEANALLGEFGTRPDVLTLAYGVSYWDVYGWTDEFARPEFAVRQQAYVDAGEPRRVYTPHFVVNGGPEKLRFQPDRVRSALEDAAPLPMRLALEPAEDGAVLQIDGPVRDTPAQLWRVEYEPGQIERTISAGPNRGRAMPHHDMVRSLVLAGDWAGGPAEFPAAPAPDGLSAAYLLQDGPGGRLLAAARLD